MNVCANPACCSGVTTYNRSDRGRGSYGARKPTVRRESLMRILVVLCVGWTLLAFAGEAYAHARRHSRPAVAPAAAARAAASAGADGPEQPAGDAGPANLSIRRLLRNPSSRSRPRRIRRMTRPAPEPDLPKAPVPEEETPPDAGRPSPRPPGRGATSRWWRVGRPWLAPLVGVQPRAHRRPASSAPRQGGRHRHARRGGARSARRAARRGPAGPAPHCARPRRAVAQGVRPPGAGTHG